MNDINFGGKVIWFTGLSGAGKTTLANEFQLFLKSKGLNTRILDGDDLRKGLNQGLGFSDNDRSENIRRAAEVAKLFLDSNFIVLCSFITPKNEMRNMAKSIIGEGNYIEVFVDCSIEECERRDVKGLYKKVREEKISDFTGISSDFDIPHNPDLILNTESNNLITCLEQLKILIGVN
ncbi:MAG: adenylyl-sulfate kinase [Fluviicola sp.]|jgi:adenylylsulfate kinase|nr:adenylyl-sulfate kinase [Fluviicola sp.]